MQQVLFEIPFPGLANGIPIYGFGMMLFLAFVVCTMLAARRSIQEGIPASHVQDLAVWVFLVGILGARLTYLIVEGQPLSTFFFIWDGGLVFYGSVLGGIVGYVLAWWFIIRKHGLSTWKLADILAPSIAMGLAVGRLGCFLNGCCYGEVACSDCPAVHFPLSSPPRFALVRSGYQTPAGFTMAGEQVRDANRVGAVDPTSPAWDAGLRPGQVIVQADGVDLKDYQDLWRHLVPEWRRGKSDLQLTVRRDGKEDTLEPFKPRTLGLHPTQVYSSIGALFIFLVLQAYYPLRRRDGAVMALLMLCYPVERFLEEMLRSDNPPMAFGLTISQNISVYLFAAGLVLTVWLWRRPVQYPAT